MKALSIRAPWWWAILHAGKNIENRSWRTDYRGPILIHASKWWGAREINNDLAFVLERSSKKVMRPDLYDMRALGGHIVGLAKIVGCVRSSSSPWFFGPYGLVLADIVPLAEPYPAKGALGLFDVHDRI